MIIALVPFLVLTFIIWRLLRRKPEQPAPATLTVTISSRSSSSFRDPSDDQGPLTQTPDGWILNPKSPLPLTLTNLQRQDAERVKKLCDTDRFQGTEALRQALVPVVLGANLRCREINAYVRQYRPIYVKALQELQAGSQEWQEASELDRRDLLPELRREAIRRLRVQPDCDLAVLFEQEPRDATLDDQLLARYGYDVLQFYLRYAADLEHVFVVPADTGPWRQSFERLAELGLAARGKSIPLAKVLTTLRLKDLRALVEDLSPPKWTRKAQAIEFLLAVPDLEARVGRQVAFRELFQLRPLPPEFNRIDLGQLSAAWQYADALALLIARTYIAGAMHLHNVHDDRESGYDAARMQWRQTDPCPLCLEAAGKPLPKKQRPTTPLHIGCRCWVEVVYD